MKKVVHSSKLNPSNLLRRVLSRTSTHSKKSPDSDDKAKFMDRESTKSNFEAELVLLKTQIDSLQITVGGMQNETERKELALANLAKDKETLSIDLKKQKRSNNNLKQQLDDERSYYFKEKEKYCHEMNNFKKLKYCEHKRKESKEHVNNSEHTNITKPSKSDQRVIIKEPIKTQSNIQANIHKEPINTNINKPHKDELIKTKQNIIKQQDFANNTQKEIQQLKESLNKTLEANYNLSVKFLRMKNTKLCIKTQLDKLKLVHDKAMQEYRLKLENIQRELNNIVQTQFMKAIPPSNKKYLQIIKQNGSLMHENLILQLEVDRLNLELERMKMLEIRNDTNRKLKYIRHNGKDVIKSIKESNHVEFNVKNKDNKKHSKKSEYEIDKIYEKYKTNDMPCIKILPIDKIGQRVSDKESSIDIPKISSKYDLMTVSNSNSSSHTNDLISLSDNITEMSFYTSLKSPEAVRTQSAPEIVQSLNNNDT